MSCWLHSGKSVEDVGDHVCSHLLADFHFFCFCFSFRLLLFWACPNQNVPTGNKRERVNPLNSNCPEGLTDLSEPARHGWNSRGCHDNSAATLPPAGVLGERRRQYRSHRHLGLFSPWCPGEIVPLEHTNGLVEVISLNLPDSSRKKTRAVTSLNGIHALFREPLRCSYHCKWPVRSSSCPFAVFFRPPEQLLQYWEDVNGTRKRAASVIMAPCYPGSIEQETTIFSTSSKKTVVFSLPADTPVGFCMRAEKQRLAQLCLADKSSLLCCVFLPLIGPTPYTQTLSGFTSLIEGTRG